ncbi:MAG: hypothetical protein BM556_11865 [Bacteriovorax sp. MedPE-SWde]|nr:MAG: hypothetical protein BM556_11865 [Bacteriovorax sp. MedPE-SWde]
MPILLILTLLIRLLIWPLVKALSFFGPLKDRVKFERRNLKEAQCISFSQTHERAEVLFHFSSEGEFEQIKSLLEVLLVRGHKLELVFTSPSVESKVQAFSKNYDDQIRYLRLPIIEFFPFIIGQNLLHWSTAKKMVMVRYDFFPELLTLGSKLSRFVLYSASMKSSTNQGLGWLVKKIIYESFSDVFCATDRDYKFFSGALDTVNIHPALDLRSLQISKRQKNFHKNELASSLKELFDVKEKSDRLCLAQFWPEESDVFKDERFVEAIKSGEKFVYLAPHKLSREFLEEITERISEITKDLKVYILDRNASSQDISDVLKKYKERPGLVISCLPGLLCEIYPMFPSVYVGGGFGKGVHSLLEAFMADTRILCGPGVHRSTEYDLIIDSGYKVAIVEDLKKLGSYVVNIQDEKKSQLDISEFLSHNEMEMNKLVKILDNHNA